MPLTLQHRQTNGTTGPSIFCLDSPGRPQFYFFPTLPHSPRFSCMRALTLPLPSPELEEMQEGSMAPSCK